MKRYNCKDFPVEMVESDSGYWVKHDDVVKAIDERDYWAQEEIDRLKSRSRYQILMMYSGILFGILISLLIRVALL